MYLIPIVLSLSEAFLSKSVFSVRIASSKFLQQDLLTALHSVSTIGYSLQKELY